VSDGEETKFDYSGLHAFLFIDHVEPGKSPEDVVKALRDIGRPTVMYASAFVGDYVAFAHIRARDLAHLQGLIADEIWKAGPRCAWSIESATGAAGVKRRSPDVIGLTRIKMQPGGITDEFLATLASKDGFVGVSVISGNFDVVLQMEGATFEDAAAKVQGALDGLEGVVRTSTAFADGSRTEELYGPIPWRGEEP
jgi:hypothetical protein